MISMPRKSFFEVSVNVNFRVSRNCLFCSKMGVRALFNFMRKLLPETSFKECDIKFNCDLLPQNERKVAR